MNGRCAVRAALVGALVIGLGACVGGSPRAVPVTPAGASPTRGQSPVAKVVLDPSGVAVALPEGCRTDTVARRMAALVADMSEHDGEAAASHFLSGPDLRWEVYEHFNPPNGTGGALLTRGQIAEFADGLRESWKVSDVVPPVGSAGLPAKSTYGVGFGITADDRARESGAKVVIDCASGLISHMVGPSGQ